MNKCEVCRATTFRRVRSLNYNGAHMDNRAGWVLCSQVCDQVKAKQIEAMLSNFRDELGEKDKNNAT